MNKYYKTYSFATFELTLENDEIIEFDRILNQNLPDNFNSNSVAINVFNQLDEYFNGTRKSFDLKYNLKGTDFQKNVWNELIKIPYGTSKTYEEIAINLNKQKACRAVGSAIGKNPVLIFIPCHRVIGKNKKLTGFSSGLDMKELLLKLEKIEFKN